MARGDQLGRQWKIIQTLITLKKVRSAAEAETMLEKYSKPLERSASL